MTAVERLIVEMRLLETQFDLEAKAKEFRLDMEHGLADHFERMALSCVSQRAELPSDWPGLSSEGGEAELGKLFMSISGQAASAIPAEWWVSWGRLSASEKHAATRLFPTFVGKGREWKRSFSARSCRDYVTAKRWRDLNLEVAT